MSFEQLLTFLPVRDLARTGAFYERGLGLRLARDQGDCRIYHVAGSAYVGFCARPASPGQPGGVVLTFVTPAVDACYQRLLAHGATAEKPPADNPRYGIYNAFVRDPDGYLIEVQRFDEPLA